MQSVEIMTFQGRAKRQNLDAKKIGDKGVGVPASLGVYFFCPLHSLMCLYPLHNGVCSPDGVYGYGRWVVLTVREVTTQCMPLIIE
jgi:hypothetical protein